MWPILARRLYLGGLLVWRGFLLARPQRGARLGPDEATQQWQAWVEAAAAYHWAVVSGSREVDGSGERSTP